MLDQMYLEDVLRAEVLRGQFAIAVNEVCIVRSLDGVLLCCLCRAPSIVVDIL